jgi:GT2 family glycosyltransferase
MKLSIHLVTWNGAKYVPYLFDSLKKQTYADWELHIWDNGSGDGMVAAMERECQSFQRPWPIHVSDTNIGFAGGHNELYKRTSTPYFLMLNQDMYLDERCLEKLVTCIMASDQIATVSPRLMRWHFQAVASGHLEDSFTEYIDTLGLKVFKNRRVIDQHAQERWSKESRNSSILKLIDRSTIPVFGVSGALALCRRSCIDTVAFSDGTYLDQSYHSYKEDVDLAYRIRSAGFESHVVPGSVAYHDRSEAGPRTLDDQAAMANKKKQSSSVIYDSYKNHLATLLKNEYWQNLLLDSPWIMWYELKKFFYYLLRDQGALKGLLDVLRSRTEIKDKRAKIKARRGICWKEMRYWWT